MQRLRLLIGAAFALTLLLSVGCEDTAVTPGEDFTMSLIARPSAVLIDATHPQGQASLVATVYSDTGAPQSGIRVLFSTTAGTLTSGNTGIETNGDGSAVDTLTIDESAPAEVTVSAVAGTLAQTVKVTKTAGNRAPTAVIVATPATEAAINRPVTFDGTTSSDPDTADTKSYSWRVESIPFGVISSNVLTPTLVFPNGFNAAQTLKVTLTVTDNHGLPGTTEKIYPIRDCAGNAAPTAVISGTDPIVATGNTGATVPVQLLGSQSSDSNGSIQTFTWTCGNGAAAVVSGSNATCSYVVSDTTQTYTVTLLVTDDGFGAPALTCQKQSTAATMHVRVNPLVLP
jgi:hypothetical protein